MTAAARRAGQEAMSGPGRRDGRIASASFGQSVLLLIQLILGVGYNLYGTAPTAAKKVDTFSSPLLAVHAIVGILLVVFAIYLVVSSVRARIRLAVITSAVGMLALLGAWASGSAFIQKGDSGFSMAMGALTAVALLCYLLNVRMLGARGNQ